MFLLSHDHFHAFSFQFILLTFAVKTTLVKNVS
jgi:hypothetical protein